MLLSSFTYGTPDLRLRLSLDEPSGTHIDASVFKNNGTVSGATQNAVGLYQNGRSVSFDDSSDYINIPHDKSLDIRAGFTIMAWFFRDDSDNGDSIVSKDINGIAFPYSFRITGADDLRLYLGDGSIETSVTASDPTAVAKWQFGVVTWDAETADVNFYINGVADSNNPQTLSVDQVDGEGDLRIGEELGGGADFDGRIDEVRIYARPFSSSEILDIYQDSDGIANYHNLELWYKFDEASGTNIEDSTSNGDNPLTITSGGTLGTTGKVNGAITLDGLNNDVNGIPANLTIIGTNDFSLCMWIRGTGTDYYTILNLSEIGMGSQDMSFSIDGGDTIGLWDGGQNDSPSTDGDLSDGNWHHVAWVRSGTGSNEFEFFSDGVSLGTTTISTDFVGHDNLGIGSFNGAENFPGDIDDLRLYNVALSSSEIATLAGMEAP